ncbi:MAG: DEAD/DEAH box helicase [Candidatus Thermoplasmatota archaeon]|nr:DEAD/DEAH box helicase [Candidatus Thermoplasmatota archaeon]
MRVDELDLHPKLIEALQAEGFEELYPSQEEAAPLACQGDSLVVCVPTASGKSLVAYMALLQQVQQGKKGIYIVPLRALASEKARDLKELARHLDVRVALTMGDLDRPEPRLSEFDIIVCTSEKADSMFRQRSHWLDKLGCVVADEVHLLHDSHRGPTLEVLLARFRHVVPDAQIVALSATVENSLEMALWLDAEHIQSDWRPVELKEGVLHGEAITFTDNSQRHVPKASEPLEALAVDTLQEGGQVIVFVNSRRSAEATAERLSKAVKDHLDPEARQAIMDATARMRAGQSNEVRDRLTKCVEGGAAFHHAGLSNEDRTRIEEMFLKGHLKLLSATPTLAAGLNLPARRIIVRDLWRWEGNFGRVPIPVLEYKQMAGRAGRPRFDPYGEAVTLAKTMDEKEEIQFRYLLSGPEAVESKLAQDWALRTHILATIASGFANTEQGIHEFIGRTFYAYQADQWAIEHRIDETLIFLIEEGFVDDSDGLKATPFGKRTSDLYIDPASAVILRDALQAAPDEPAPIQLLHALAATPDMPLTYLRNSDVWVEEEALELEENVLVPYHQRVAYDQYQAEVKTALLLHDWIEEKSDDALYQRYGAYPGDVHNRVSNARWLLHAAQELRRLFAPDLAKPLSTLSLRVRHGAKEELLPILKLKGIGRYRARQLHEAGFKTREALAEADPQALLTVRGMGPSLVRNIKEQLGQTLDEIPEPSPTEEVEGQVSLGHFD